MLKLDIKNSGVKASLLKRSLKMSAWPFLRLPHDAGVIRAVEEFARDMRNKYSNLVVLGVGGSARGGVAMVQALAPNQFANVKFVQNIEPDPLTHFLKTIDFKRTLFCVISKSGETIETMATFAILQERLQKAVGEKWRKQVVVITDPEKGLLHEIAKKYSLARFSVPSDVSGRFSALSPVGLFPAAFAGLNIEAIANGAKSAQQENAQQLAAIQYHLNQKQKKHATVFFPYSSRLGSFCDWYIQLLAESIGKTPKIGITPLKAIGILDQHTQLQLFMDGPNDKFFIFIEIEKFDHTIKIPSKLLEKTSLDFLKNHTMNELFAAEKHATEQALARAGRPNMTVKIPRLDEHSLGELFMLFQMEVAMLGELYGVNPFNQPGVELGKKLTKQFLQAA